MSRLTGTDAYSLMEAYQAVYAPQELTEEQVWEEVETWVNDLIEEGYDLSDYTWEEMYESYLSEFSGNLIGDLKANAGNIARGVSGAYQGAMQAGSRVNQAVSDRMQRNIKPITTPKPSPRTFQSDSGGSAGFGRYAEPTQFTTPTPKKTPASDLKAGTRDLLNRNRTKTPAPAPARPAAAAPARPAAAAPARTTPPARPAATAPAAPKPAMGPTGKPLVGGIERRTPTSAELKAAQAARAGGGALAQATAAASKPAAFSPTPAAATPTPAARPATPARPTPRQTRLNMEMVEYDTFDTVLEYLVSEGYADTEESALVIMANMSEEWKQSIVTA